MRACYDLLRRTRRERLHIALEDVELSTAPVETRARDLLEWGLAQLDAKERLVITLLELEEQSITEIAALTGWSESNVKVRAFRARQRLKEILSDER